MAIKREIFGCERLFLWEGPLTPAQEDEFYRQTSGAPVSFPSAAVPRPKDAAPAPASESEPLPGGPRLLP